MANEEFKWKASQEGAIKEKEGEIIVSASAGSGKTAVMIERLIRLIDDGVNVDQVLCLTFPESAAKEINVKLKNAIIQKLEQSVGEKRQRFIDQLDKLPHSDITTIDAFCKRLVSRYFEKAGVDPSFSVASDDESKNYKHKVAEKTLAYFGELNDATYYDLLDFFGKKRSEDDLIKIIIKIDEFLSSIENRDEFVRDVLINQSNIEASETMLYVGVVDRIEADIRYITNKCLLASKYGLYYTDLVNNYLSKAIIALGKNGFDAFVKELKTDKPENPDYRKKPYKDCEESAEDIKTIKAKLNAFTDKYSNYSYEVIQSDLARNAPYVKTLVSLASEFRAEYQKTMERANLLDFSMIEDKASVCLQDELVRQETASRYSHVLVDEYQDTNRLQDDIILKCSGGKSLFMVGDAKQSIYEFRHAEPTLFMEKKNKVGIKAHKLTENFRTDDKIIEGINKIFTAIYTKEVAGEDYATQKMIPENIGKPVGFEPISLQVLLTDPRESKAQPNALYSVEDTQKEEETVDEKKECLHVFNQINDVVENGKIWVKNKLDDEEYAERRVEYKDIAVLYRSRTPLVKALMEKLRHANIPVSVTEKGKLPYSAELLIHILKVVDNHYREDSLVNVMLALSFGFTENELCEYKLKGKKDVGFWECLQSIRDRYPKLDAFLSKIEDYKFRASYKSVADLCDYVISDIDYEVKIASLEDGMAELNELERYLASIRQSKTANNLSDYLNYFEKYPEFTSKKVMGSAEGVKFMTIHESKGLEFPVVFLIGCGGEFKKNNDDVFLHKKYGLTLSSFDPITRKYRTNFFKDSMKDRLKEDTIAQELRLLYVATTRAKNMLFMSGTSKCTKAEKLTYKDDVREVNSFLDFLLCAIGKDGDVEKIVKYEVGEGNQSGGTVLAVSNTVKEEINVNAQVNYEYPHQKATVTRSKYTVTGILKNDDETPHVSLTKSESAEIGTLYHTVMENVDLSISKASEVKEALDKMLLDEIITQKEREEIDEEVVLKSLNSSVIRSINGKKTLKEQAFLLRVPANELKEGEVSDEVLLQGVIDLLILDDVPVIVDYKYSGASKDVLKKRYAGQLDLYEMAVKKILNVDKVKKYLLSLKTGEVVEFD